MKRLALRVLCSAVLAAAMPLVPGRDAGLSGWHIEAAAQTLKKQPQAAKRKKREAPPAPEAAPAPAPATDPAAAAAAAPADALPPERVEADVSTRSIAVTSGFTGTEIIVFGSVENSRQSSAEAGYYDVAVVVEGLPTPLVARRKSNVAGLWINTAAAAFVSVPSYYAITATRPLDEIADEAVLKENAIGLDYVRMTPTTRTAAEVPAGNLKDYTSAVIRLKEQNNLYLKDEYAVAFIGRSLFRSSIALPANVPVGPLTARVYLFRDGALLSSYQTSVRLEREGIELWLYRFATTLPLLYGLFAVTVAVLAGLVASAVFWRGGR